MDDDVMARVTEIVERGRAGDRESARRDLTAVWAELDGGTDGGDAFHRCVVAHFLADLQDDVRDELAWDERALAAAGAVSDARAQRFYSGLRVRGFLPSLCGSVADDHRRLGAADRAREFLDRAWDAADALEPGPYGDHVRGVLRQIDDALRSGSADALPTS